CMAATAGVDSLEVCSWLGCGGITPALGLVRVVHAHTGLPVRVLVRPVPGPFHFGPEARAVVLEDVALFCAEPGVRGVVTGALDAAGMPDGAFMRAVLDRANGREITFHRAFDEVPDQVAALERCRELGVHRILTSGGEPRAIDAVDRLRHLTRLAGNMPVIAAGGGLAPDHVRWLVQQTGVPEVHFSAGRATDKPFVTAPDAGKVHAIMQALGRGAMP